MSPNQNLRYTRLGFDWGSAMRLSGVEIKAIRRFSHLTIKDIPATAKLVFLCGPNGSGKSSLFDGLRHFFLQHTHGIGGQDYLLKKLSESAAATLFPVQMMQGPDGVQHPMPNPRSSTVTVGFHPDPGASPPHMMPGPNGQMVPMQMGPQLTPDSFYFRSAHRNEAEFVTMAIGGPSLAGQNAEMAGPRTIDNDAAVSRNYQRLVSNSVVALWGTGSGDTTFDQYRAEKIGQIAGALSSMFPDLTFTGVGSPLQNGTFTFNKGVSLDFPYRDLSSGEKAAFDLLLDVFARQTQLANTVMCIDEPEAHLNVRVHGDLLSVLFNNIADRSQLWIASHSVGMMRRARDLALAKPGEIIFLDFENQDFDEAVTLRPVEPDRELWKRALKIALDDIGDLVAPEHIVICEGEDTDKSLDAKCYGSIFAHTHPETQFVPGGSESEISNDKRGYAYLVNKLTPGAKVTRLTDRDDKSEAEIMAALPVRTLSRRNVESYIFSDEILERFAEARIPGSWANIQHQIADVLATTAAKYPGDDRKPAANDIALILRKSLGLHGKGSSYSVLAREMICHEVVPGTQTYADLERSIFGTEASS